MNSINKEKFDKAVSYITREGKESLLNWIEKSTDFYTAPASCDHHGNFEGGLLEHSLNVLEFALTNFNYLLKKKPELEDKKESVIITALFHDLCKVNQYKKVEKWVKDSNNQWQKYIGWEVKDTFPYGHGEKSVYLLSKHIQLTQSEALAIRWHMGSYEVGVTVPGLTKTAYDKVFDTEPLAVIIHAADIMATVCEKTIDYKALAIKK